MCARKFANGILPRVAINPERTAENNVRPRPLCNFQHSPLIPPKLGLPIKDDIVLENKDGFIFATNFCNCGEVGQPAARVRSPCIQHRSNRVLNETFFGTDRNNANHGFLARKMSVTVTMPTKNRPQCAARAIEAFLHQRGRDEFEDEMVVVDTSDVSFRKEMRTIAAASRKRTRGKNIHWIWLPSRTTLGAARNRACASSRNELVMLWDDDDMHGPDRIVHQTRAWHAGCTGANLVGECFVRMFHRDALQTSAWLGRDTIKSLFAHGGVHGTALFSQKAWRAVGGFPEEAGAVPGEDVVFLTRLARHGFKIGVADTDEQASDSVFAINRYSHPEHGHAWQNFYHMHAATTTA